MKDKANKRCCYDHYGLTTGWGDSRRLCALLSSSRLHPHGLAVEEKNRAHKLLSVAHRLNLYARMLQIKRGCISKHIYQSIKILTIISWVRLDQFMCRASQKSEGWRVKNDIERGFFVPQRDGVAIDRYQADLVDPPQKCKHTVDGREDMSTNALFKKYLRLCSRI